MPLGWYLAQGLYPLGPDSSDDDEGPCELPDGRLVCGPHGFVRCYKCCTDYSFMSENDEDDEDEEDVDDDKDEHKAHSSASSPLEGPRTQHPSANRPAMTAPNPLTSCETEKRRGTGRAFPTKFCPPSSTITPEELFSGRRAWVRAIRSVALQTRRVFMHGLTQSIRRTHRNDPGMLLLYTDGACLNNGQANPKAGWAFVHHAGPSPGDPANFGQGRLEAKGPFGDDGAQSSSRAELRAAIAALQFRHWAGERFHTAVIATDSEYVVEGATAWAKKWARNGWETNRRAPVRNSDMWQMLLGEVERWQDEGMDVQFWRIPREWNAAADAAAKKAAEGPDRDEWTKLVGMAI